MADDKRHLREYYRQIFEEDKRGQAIFADLYDRFVRRPNPNDYTQEGVLKVFVQTHQREVVEYMARMAGAASEIPDTTPEGEDDA